MANANEIIRSMHAHGISRAKIHDIVAAAELSRVQQNVNRLLRTPARERMEPTSKAEARAKLKASVKRAVPAFPEDDR